MTKLIMLKMTITGFRPITSYSRKWACDSEDHLISTTSQLFKL